MSVDVGQFNFGAGPIRLVGRKPVVDAVSLARQRPEPKRQDFKLDGKLNGRSLSRGDAHVARVFARRCFLRHVHDRVILPHPAGGNVHGLIRQKEAGDHRRLLRRANVQIPHQPAQDEADVGPAARQRGVATPQVAQPDGDVRKVVDRVDDKIERLVLAGCGETFEGLTDPLGCRRLVGIEVVFPVFACNKESSLCFGLERVDVGGQLPAIHVQFRRLHRSRRQHDHVCIGAGHDGIAPNTTGRRVHLSGGLGHQNQLLHPLHGHANG